MADEQAYDRGADDLGNVIALEHVNLRVPDQGLAALFYVTGLGGTRDPYMDFGLANVWVNFGEQQFHLPTGEPQRFGGEITLVVPDLERLGRRLERVAEPLAGTCFAWEEAGDALHVRCPWGNRLRCREPGVRAGMRLGIADLAMSVSRGTAPGLARFYREVLGAPARDDDGAATVAIGRHQTLRFLETQAPPPEYDGHHIAIYVADFSGPHRWLAERGLITEESGPHQYRFQRLADPQDGRALTELEHEVRSLYHPLYGRVLVNR